MSCTWSNTGQKSGSRWPSMGVSIACKTRGCTLLGPGPSKMRFGRCKSFTEAFMDAWTPSNDGRDGVWRRLERPRANMARAALTLVRHEATVPGIDQLDEQPGRREAKQDQPLRIHTPG